MPATDLSHAKPATDLEEQLPGSGKHLLCAGPPLQVLHNTTCFLLTRKKTKSHGMEKKPSPPVPVWDRLSHTHTLLDSLFVQSSRITWLVSLKRCANLFITSTNQSSQHRPVQHLNC